MKSLTKWIIIILIATCIFSMSSCEKVGVTVGGQIGPVYVQLSFGGGTGAYYGYGNVPNNVNTSVVYIVSKPLDQTAIAVFDQNGRQMGTVTCTSGAWQQANQMFQFLQNWNYNVRPCAVLVEWDQKWTSAPWTGKIIG
ncbi:MAG: hypothetical protein AAB895_01750, partial [Patescibacteria group bacterium]